MKFLQNIFGLQIQPLNRALKARSVPGASAPASSNSTNYKEIKK